MKTADQLRKQARQKHIEGDTQAAIMLLTQAISSDPSNTLVALDMVQIFLDIGEIAQAQGLFDKLPESAKKSEMGVSIFTQLNFIRLAQNTTGVTALKIQLTKNSEDYQAHFDLAVCFFAQHEIEKGMENLFFIQAQQPDFKAGAAKEMIGLICNMLASSNLEASNNYRRRLGNLYHL